MTAAEDQAWSIDAVRSPTRLPQRPLSVLSMSQSAAALSVPVAATPQTASLIEVFSAIQGEGLNVGTRQLFIRFAGCDLRCRYCDSAHTWHLLPQCRIEQRAGQRQFADYPNPVTVPFLLDWVKRLEEGSLHDSISLTGGEPLLQADFLGLFLPILRQHCSLPIYLETGGHRPQDLEQLLPFIDMVGMDLKLPSVSGESHWLAHRQFLALCDRPGLTVFCKVIVDAQTSQTDLVQVADLLASVNRAIPLFLQPVTPLGATEKPVPPNPEQVLTWQAQLKQHIKSVRVIPQTHKMLHQL